MNVLVDEQFHSRTFVWHAQNRLVVPAAQFILTAVLFQGYGFETTMRCKSCHEDGLAIWRRVTELTLVGSASLQDHRWKTQFYGPQKKSRFSKRDFKCAYQLQETVLWVLKLTVHSVCKMEVTAREIGGWWSMRKGTEGGGGRFSLNKVVQDQNV
jgi:hypothetical protein